MEENFGISAAGLLDESKITPSASAVLCFDEENEQRVVCVDFCYDASEELLACDVVNLLTRSATEDNIRMAQTLLQMIGTAYQVPLYDASLEDKVKADAFAVLRELEALRERPGHAIAECMWFLQNEAEPDEPLTDEDAYILASKFEAARGSWFGTTVLHAEYLEALKDLLESGVNERNAPGFPALSPEETLDLLLVANNQVFGTLVEAAAVQSCERYAPYDYQLDQEDLDAVEKAAADIKGLMVGDVLSQAELDCGNVNNPPLIEVGACKSLC